MQIFLTFISIFSPIFFVLFLNCQDEVNKTPPLDRVILVEKSNEASPVERGIDAIPELDAIFLEWFSGDNKDLAGYTIYRSQTSDQHYAAVGKIVKQYGRIDTSFIDESVTVGVQYYYYVRAYDRLEQVGEPSDTVSYALLPKPTLTSPIKGASVTDSVPNFQWNHNDPSPPDEFIFRLKRTSGSDTTYVRIVIQSINYTGQFENWSLSELGLPAPLSAGQYMWRIDPLIPGTNQGSESRWENFSVP